VAVNATLGINEALVGIIDVQHGAGHSRDPRKINADILGLGHTGQSGKKQKERSDAHDPSVVW
jgi:hypothetical protein